MVVPSIALEMPMLQIPYNGSMAPLEVLEHFTYSYPLPWVSLMQTNLLLSSIRLYILLNRFDLPLVLLSISKVLEVSTLLSPSPLIQQGNSISYLSFLLIQIV